MAVVTPFIAGIGLASCFVTIDESRLGALPSTVVPDAGSHAPQIDSGGPSPSDASSDVTDASCIGNACPPVVLARGLHSPTWIAADETSIYVIENSESLGTRIKQVRKDVRDQDRTNDLGVIVTISKSARPVSAIVITREPALYWSIADDAGGVWRCSLPACTPTRFAGNYEVIALATDNTRVVWSIDTFGPPMSVRQCLVGSTCIGSTLLSEDPVRGIVVTKTEALTSSRNYGIVALSLDGEEPRTINASPLENVESAGAFAASANHVYWVRGDREMVMCPRSGCVTPTLVATVVGPRNLALNSTRIAWANGAALSGIYTCPLDGCGDAAGTLLAADPGAPYAVLLDESFAYWSDRASGEIRKVHLP
jgi:hypothetical protein